MSKTETASAGKTLECEDCGSIGADVKEGFCPYAEEIHGEWKWHVRKNGEWGYYARTNSKYERGKARPMIEMHRFIIGAEKGQTVDHINRNTLDNRRSNLRFVTKSQNCINQKPRHNSSKYKGVYRKKKNVYPLRPWIAQIKFNKTTYTLGNFATEEEAARAYDKKARELCPEYAYFNFPENHGR